MKFDNGMSISNNFLFDGGYLNTHALVNNGNPSTLGTYITSTGLTLPAALTAAAVVADLTRTARRCRSTRAS